MKNPRDILGPPLWSVMHGFAAAYDGSPKQAQAMKMFLEVVIPTLFPCETCQVNFRKKLKKYPIANYLENNHSMFYWTYLIHDIVNQYKGVVSPDFIEVKSYWFSAVNKECSECRITK